MGLMDSSRRNSIWAKKEKKKKAGARWLWSQIRPLVTQEGNTHLPPNVPSHNFENMDGEMDRAHVIVAYVSYHRTFKSRQFKQSMVSMFVPGLTWSVLLSFCFESWMQHSSSKRSGRNMLEVFQRGIKGMFWNDPICSQRSSDDMCSSRKA